MFSCFLVNPQKVIDFSFIRRVQYLNTNSRKLFNSLTFSHFFRKIQLNMFVVLFVHISDIFYLFYISVISWVSFASVWFFRNVFVCYCKKLNIAMNNNSWMLYNNFILLLIQRNVDPALLSLLLYLLLVLFTLFIWCLFVYFLFIYKPTPITFTSVLSLNSPLTLNFV